jgi:hypothetical protein
MRLDNSIMYLGSRVQKRQVVANVQNGLKGTVQPYKSIDANAITRAPKRKTRAEGGATAKTSSLRKWVDDSWRI